MKTVHKEALVPYSQQQMYDLVDDIAAYPQFLPWCERAEVLTRDAKQVTATLHLQWKGFSKSFTTRNMLEGNSKMDISLVDGPFKSLHGYWHFAPLGDVGCKVTVSLQFEFNNSVISYAFSQVFEYIASTLVDCFTKRADDVYGR